MNQRAASTRGFTLIEVLIAIVVLAFGLLGIVAVFPAVIDVQRRAQDAVLGGALAASAEAELRGSIFETDSRSWISWKVGDDNEGTPEIAQAARFDPTGVFRFDQYFSSEGRALGLTPASRVDFLWETDWTWRGQEAATLTELRTEGTLRLGGGLGMNGFPRLPVVGDAFIETTSDDDSPGIGIGERLLPGDGSESPPRYIWDVVVRRVDAGIGEIRPDGRSRDVTSADLPRLPIEVAVFVRPIDRGIRVPPGLTLRDVLRGYSIDENGAQQELDERTWFVSNVERLQAVRKTEPQKDNRGDCHTHAQNGDSEVGERLEGETLNAVCPHRETTQTERADTTQYGEGDHVSGNIHQPTCL